VRAKLFNRRPQAGADGEEAADEGKYEGRPSGRPGSESVHRTTLATRDEPNRCQVGPTILVDRPRQDPPPLVSFVSQLGPPFCGPRAEHGPWVGGEAFQISAPPIKMMRYRR
jgi:hypothetical protein